MKKLWFKRKRYGWGWYPATWQGWLITFSYVLSVIVLGTTIKKNSSPVNIFLTFPLPLIILTICFIKIAYARGEKPRWQWGKS